MISEASSHLPVLIVLIRWWRAGASPGLLPPRRRQVALCFNESLVLASFVSDDSECVLFFFSCVGRPLLLPPEMQEQPLFTTKVSPYFYFIYFKKKKKKKKICRT